MHQKILSLLDTIGQSHLKEGLEDLSPRELEVFLKELQRYAKKKLPPFQKLQVPPFSSDALPYQDVHFSGDLQDRNLGHKLLAEGKVGCLVLAGGDGTRLGHPGPKGCVPVTPLTRKSLFRFFAKRQRWQVRPQEENSPYVS